MRTTKTDQTARMRVQADLSLRRAHMLAGTFSYDATQITCNIGKGTIMPCTNDEGSVQPDLLRSRIRAFTVHLKNT